MAEDNWSQFISLGGVTSLGASILFAVLSKVHGHKSQQLDAALPVERLDELWKLTTLTMPLLVAVRGRVGSDAPKQCELCDKKAVIHEIVEEEIWRKEKENGRIVHEPFETRKVMEVCEWFLDDGSGRLRVENANTAERLHSAMEVKQVFVPVDMSTRSSLVRLMIDQAWQMTKQGVRKTERYLPVGSVVTVVGELAPSSLYSDSKHASSSTSSAASAAGSASSSMFAPPPSLPKPFATKMPASAFVLRRPPSGPFYLTPMTLQQLQAVLSNAARTYKYIAWGCGALGAYLIARKAIGRLLQVWRQARIRRRVAQAELERKQRLAAAVAEGGAAVAEGSADAAGGDDRAPGTCVVCMDRGVEMVFPACGHMCCCFECGHRMRRCPVCRTNSVPIKVYRP